MRGEAANFVSPRSTAFPKRSLAARLIPADRHGDIISGGAALWLWSLLAYSGYGPERSSTPSRARAVLCASR